MKDNVSPEEKLLNLIKGEKKQKVAIDKKIVADTADLKSAIKNTAQATATAYPAAVNIKKLLPVFFVVSVIYLLISFIYPWLGSKEIKLPDVQAQKSEEPNPKPEEAPKPYEFYLQGIRQHQIFVSPGGTVSSQETALPLAAADVDLTKDISLVGIISGANPQAVIEDKKAQKTYYAVKGQRIGEIQVVDILEGKIIISYKGNRFELYL